MRRLSGIVESLDEKVLVSNIEYINEVRNLNTLKLSKDELEKTARKIMFKGIQNDLMKHDYQSLISTYIAYFNTKSLRKITIDKGSEFFRGRLGIHVFKGGENDSDEDFMVPYHNEQIGTAPHLLVKGGRFNREGVSYLYLASDIKTCLAEIHLQVGQECSVAKFKVKEDIVLMNLVESSTDLEMRIWYEILTQPVYEDIKYKYLITQFLADVFSRKFENGILFNSSQGNGRNIVSFKPYQFELIPYSEKIYSIKSISIKEKLITDSADEYVERNKKLKAYNQEEIQKKEKEFKYLDDLMKVRKDEKKRLLEKTKG